MIYGILLSLALAVEAPPSLNPRALELLDRDAVVKAWALGHHDDNHDGWLTLYEANQAVDEFKTIADADRDGRVTPREYDGGIDFLKARYRPLPD